MRSLWVHAAALIVASALVGCGDERLLTPASSPVSPEDLARDLVSAAGWPLEVEQAAPDIDPGASPSVFGFRREPIVGDIVHYSFDVPVGTGPYEVIGIHRVVRETAPFRPEPTREAVFLAHGDAADFAACFLAIEGTPPDRALSVFLAQAGIDVWGLDFAWSRIPESATDFSFLAGWGIEKDAQHLGVGVAVAREARSLSGAGRQKMHLFGYSGGGQTSYAYLCQETLMPPGKRHIKGFVPFDSDPAATNSPELAANCCALEASYQAMLDAGTYQDVFGLTFSTAGVLAETAPHDPSPLVPGLDNMQAALFFAAATWNIFPYTPYIHFAGGEFDGSGMPTALRYSDLDTYLGFTKSLKPYFPAQVFRDRYATNCGETDVSWNDGLGDISVPILVIAAGGGIGEYSVYGAQATASRDVTVHTVDLAADRSLDFGHIDLITARDAPALVWTPVRDWMLSH